MKLRTLSELNAKGKTILLRTDFNVPLKDGVVQDNTRIRESLPTIQKLLTDGARVVIASHLGRPKGKTVPEFSLAPVAEELSKLLVNTEVIFLNDCIGPTVKTALSSFKEGEVILLENLRFHPEEEANDPAFSAELAEGFDAYVSDAFGTVHRAHASTSGVTKFLPSYAGLLLEKEIRVLSGIMENPLHPVCLLVGGAKVDTKIGILEKFLEIADSFVIGGALANTFLVAEGKGVGTSLYEADKVQVAKDFLAQAKAKGKTVLLPTDVVLGADIVAGTHVANSLVDDVPADMKILDLGVETCAKFSEAILGAKTVIWNGPVGFFELPEFESGTKTIAEAVSKVASSGVDVEAGVTVLGGGDTIDAINYFGINPSQFTHISTGGGAMLEFLEGKVLPGVAALMES